MRRLSCSLNSIAPGSRRTKTCSAAWFVVAVLLLCGAAIAEPFWQRLPDLPEPMGNFACGALDKAVVVAGGVTWKGDTKQFLDGIWYWRHAQPTWTHAGNLPNPIAYAGSGQAQDRLCIAGGSDGNRMRTDLLRIDAKGSTCVVAKLHSPSAYAGSSMVNDRLWMIAGAKDSTDLKTMTSTVLSLSIENGETAMVPEYPGGALMLPAAVYLGEVVYVFAGAELDSAGQVANVDQSYAYSIRGGEWRAIVPYPLKVRGLAACALDDRYILLAGGYVADFTDASFVYDTRTNTYLGAAALPYRAMVTLVRSGKYVYCLGGEDRMKSRTNLFYRIAVADILESMRHLP